MSSLETSETSTQYASSEICSSVVAEIMARDEKYLDEVYRSSYVRQLIEEATGVQAGLYGREFGHATKERESITSRYLCDLADSFILFARSKSVNSSESVDYVFQTLNQWSEEYLHSVFVSRRRGRVEREYSMYHRFKALIQTSYMVYRDLTSLGAQEGLDTYRLSLIIALKSKNNRLNPREDLTDYGVVAQAFGVWNVNPVDYIGLLQDRAACFEALVVNVYDQYTIVRAYLNLSSQDKDTLDFLVIQNSKVSYGVIFREFFGINEEEERFSLAGIGSRYTIPYNYIQWRIWQITRFVLDAHESPFSYDRVEACEFSLVMDYSYPLSGPMVAKASDVGSILFENYEEVLLYRQMKAAEVRTEQLEFMNVDNRWQIEFAFYSEYLWHLRVLSSFIEALRADIHSGLHNASHRYSEVTEREYDYLHDIYSRLAGRFSFNLSERFQFRREHFDWITCRGFVTVLTGISRSEYQPTVRLGALHRRRLIAGEMLEDPNLIMERVKLLASMIPKGGGYKGRTTDAAIAIGCTVNTINYLSIYFILEAICSGINSNEDRVKMARCLGVSELELGALVIQEDDSEYLSKLQAAIRLVLLKLCQVGRESSKSPYGHPNIVIRRRGALDIALEVITKNSNFRVLRFYLFGTLCGYNAQEICRMLTEIKSFYSTIFPTFTETEKVLFVRPPSRRKK